MNEDVIITVNPEYRRQLLDNLKAQMGVGVRRDGVHVSDLIFCVRKAWAERILGFVEEVSDTTVLTWLRGLSHEELVADGIQQIRAGYCYPCQKNWPADPRLADNGWHCPDCGETLLVGTIDWIEMVGANGRRLEDFTPTEMKSTMKSSRQRLDGGDMAWFADQVKTYMAMHGRQRGHVVILHVQGDYRRQDKEVRSSGPPAELISYDIAWRDPSGPANWLARMQTRKAAYEDDTHMPPLGPDSPVHDYICDYCSVGEKLPNGEECERWPWRLEPETGLYVRKGSARRSMSMDEMLGELTEIQQRHDAGAMQQLEESVNGTE